MATIKVDISQTTDTIPVEMTTGSSGGTTDHAKLKNRDASDQHPISAITDLSITLNQKMNEGEVDVMSNQDIEELLNLFV